MLQSKRIKNICVLEFFVIFAYNKNVKTVDLDQCTELLLEDVNFHDVHPIYSLRNNHAKNDEISRMKFYFLEKVMHFRLSNSSDFKNPHIAVFINGNGGLYVYHTGIARVSSNESSWDVVKQEITEGLTCQFFYTELWLVIKKCMFFLLFYWCCVN